jgi:hypothetical protein
MDETDIILLNERDSKIEDYGSNFEIVEAYVADSFHNPDPFLTVEEVRPGKSFLQRVEDALPDYSDII